MNNDKKIVEFKGIVIANPCNLENYKVYGLAVDYYQYPEIQVNKYNNVSITGNLPELDDGIEYMVKAEEQEYKHGTSYKVINIKRDRPRTESATRLFLQEILTSYEQVEEIMREYPDIIDRVINNRVDDIDLKKLYNIGEYRFRVIKRKIIENFALAELVDEFKGFIEFKVLKILYDRYGSVDKIKEELKNNPYKCLCGLSRIGFKTADKILLEFNKECQKIKQNGEKPPIDFNYDLQTSSQRQKAAIMFLLEENENNGNTKIGIKELRKQSESLAKKCIEHFVGIIKDDVDIYFDKETKTVALYKTYETEKYIAERFTEGLKVKNEWNIDTEKYKSNSDITLTDQQYQVLPMICNSNICILNGFGGSGKSATTKSVIDMLKDNKKSFVLFAPTGRASKVLAEYTQEQASTIHRTISADFMRRRRIHSGFSKVKENSNIRHKKL
jgi:exodeoxyribonuclease V alpha subunit